MDYITVKQLAEKWDLTVRRIQQLCEHGKIQGAVRPARDWLIPNDIEKPKDKRYKNGKQKTD
jgi:hypothetical protein